MGGRKEKHKTKTGTELGRENEERTEKVDKQKHGGGTMANTGAEEGQGEQGGRAGKAGKADRAEDEGGRRGRSEQQFVVEHLRLPSIFSRLQSQQSAHARDFLANGAKRKLRTRAMRT